MPDAMICHWCESADAAPLSVLCVACLARPCVARLYRRPMDREQARALLAARRAAEAEGDLFAPLAQYRIPTRRNRVGRRR